jgi:hypothetical protein
MACGPRVAGGVTDLGITGLVLQESPVTITEICARAGTLAPKVAPSPLSIATGLRTTRPVAPM